MLLVRHEYEWIRVSLLFDCVLQPLLILLLSIKFTQTYRGMRFFTLSLSHTKSANRLLCKGEWATSHKFCYSSDTAFLNVTVDIKPTRHDNMNVSKLTHLTVFYLSLYTIEKNISPQNSANTHRSASTLCAFLVDVVHEKCCQKPTHSPWAAFIDQTTVLSTIRWTRAFDVAHSFVIEKNDVSTQQ